MSLYKREGSPFWWYSINVDGLRLRGSTEKTSKREARQVEAQQEHDARHRAIPKDRWTIRQCFASYWSEKAKHKSSHKATLVKLVALERILGKDRPIMHITNPDLMDYRAKRQREGLQAHSVNRDFAYLKASLRHAQQIHGQQIPNLAWKELRQREPDGRTRFLSRDEYERLLDACDPDLSLIVKVAVSTGLRKNNLLHLDWQEVDLSSGMISVTIKGNKRHAIRMPANIRAALSTLPDRKGKVFNTTNFRKHWDAAVLKAGLTDFRFHDLRHTCATWMRMAGVDIADICDALGHSSVTVTMRYAHIEPETHVSPFDRISERVWSQSGAQSTIQVKK